MNKARTDSTTSPLITPKANVLTSFIQRDIIDRALELEETTKWIIVAIIVGLSLLVAIL